MSEVLCFVKPNNYNNVLIKSDQIVAFDRVDGKILVYLKNGGCIEIRGGYWEYEQIKKAMEEQKC